MLKPLRRTDREMDMNLVNSLLSSGQYGVLSSIGDNGYAYGVPLSYVFMNNSIYFHCAAIGHKLENIHYNNKGKKLIESNEHKSKTKEHVSGKIRSRLIKKLCKKN